MLISINDLKCFCVLRIHCEALENTASEINQFVFPGSEGEDTTMTPTLDRVAVSNLTKALSVPNLPVRSFQFLLNTCGKQLVN